MYPYNRNTQLYHSRAKETQAEKPSLLAQDKRLEELLSLARTEATETTRKFETLLDRAELSEAGQILRTMYLDGKKASAAFAGGRLSHFRHNATGKRSL